jgi:Domain of unknown function (DUF3472)/Domain of unknown function (DUF5077)/Glycosyl hydrolases family 2, TIM barrel domain
MSGLHSFVLCLTIVCNAQVSGSAGDRGREPRVRWSAERANTWYAGKGWLRGCDFIPSTAINQLEMWQAGSFDAKTIDRELGYAESIGLNCMRVFLHHLAWEEDPSGFKGRMERYLDIAARHHIVTIFVFFDDCWNESYHAGPQPAPRTGIHNSGWVRDPGKLYYDEPSLVDTLQAYVKDVMTRFRNDPRILLWDLYNEPGNSGYGVRSLPLLENVFKWGQEVNPSQPLSAGIWDDHLDVLNAWQLAHSDVITYHNYSGPEGHQRCIDSLRKYGRPLICTEYMARLRNSTFFNIMPLLKRENIAAINWGLVTGKTNTKYAWDMPMPDGAEPKVWFHDIFRPDGTPFDPKETAFIKQLTNPSDTIPLGGNAWRHRSRGVDPVNDSAGGYIDNSGIGGWTDSAVCFNVWLRTSRPGDLRVSILGSVPSGNTTLMLEANDDQKSVIMQMEGADSRTYGPFSFTVRDTGYQRIRIRAVKRDGPVYADIPAIVVEGAAVNGLTAFVPNNEGNFFHWGRRGPSVHLNYPLPDGFDASWFYNEVTVPAGQDVQGSYFMACGFGQGYFGMQVNSPTERHILFSVWSPFETDDPAAIPDSQRIRLLDKGADVHTGAFGNEGAGGQSYLNYPWKAGHTYGFLLHAGRAGDRHTIFTAWFFAPEEGRWRLIARFSRPQTSAGLTSLYSFLENFEPEEGDRNRYVLFNHGWAGDSTGHWVSLHRARFTVDNTGRKGYRLDYGGGVRNRSFYLENDGFFNGYTPAGIWLDREPDPGDRGPDIALPR